MATNGIGEYQLGTGSAWDEYVERLEMYCVCHKLASEEQKRAVLLSCCGAETYSLIVTLVKPSRPTTANYADIVAAVKSHMHPRPSELYARFKFYKRNQAAGESIADYVTALRKLAGDCEFGDKQLPLDIMLRDRFVCGIRSETIQQRLLAEHKLTFDAAYDLALTAEAAARQLKDINEDRKTVADGDASVHATAEKSSPHEKKESCYRCNGKHLPTSCKFKTSTCYKCQKLGHIAAACRSKKQAVKPATGSKRGSAKQVHEVDELFSICELTEAPKKYMVEVSIANEQVTMEVDSGASCSIVSEDTFRKIEASSRKKIPIVESSTKLVTWSSETLPTLGKAMVDVVFRGHIATLPLLVVGRQGNSLLGRNWFPALGIGVQGIQKLSSSEEDLTEAFQEIFGSDLPGFKGAPLHIELKDTAEPKFLKCRPVPFALREDVNNELDRLQKQGILEPTQYASWATPLVVVRKKDGSLRLCGDYRSTVNKAVKSNVYPLPTTTEVFAAIGTSCIFTKLDLAQAYQQLTLDDESAELLTINTLKGLYRVRRLPFGVSAAPGLFQRVVDSLISGIPGVVAYLDDIIISGKTKQEHNERVEAVLRRLQDARLRVNKDKCQFGKTSIEYLGHKIDASGIHPSASKVAAIHSAPAPTNKKELQAFLGMVNFYSRFLEGKAEVAEILHRLLDDGRKWTWTREHQNAFESLKKLLTSESLLVKYDASRPLVLCCDASPVGVGAVLAHQDDSGNEFPIAYASRTLGKSERNYAQIDREGLAVVYGVRHFHQYLAGRSFTIITDHKPLLGLFGTDKRMPEVLSPRMLRWTLLLSAYNYQIKYRKGQDNSNADGLSRLPLPGDVDEPAPPGDILLLEAVQYPPLLATDIAGLTEKDTVLSRVKQWVFSGWPDDSSGGNFAPFEVRQTELSVHRDCLLWGNRVVIPKAARSKVLQLLHANHPGMTAMKAMARSLIWWPKLDQEIEEFVRYCEKCQTNRQSDPKAPVHFWMKPEQPWSRLHVDFAGPVKGEVFLVIVDAYSNWVEVEIMPSMTSTAVIRSLRKCFATHGLPDVIVSDNGTAFTSQEMQDFLRLNAVRFMYTAPYHPASNGRAERMVREVKATLKKQSQGDTQCRISRFLFKQHTTPHSVTGKTPAELMMGRKLRSPLDRLHPDRIREPERPDTKVKKFQLGDAVYMRSFIPGPRWKAAKVVAIMGPVSYRVQQENGEIHRRHRDQLRKAWLDVSINPTSRDNAVLLPPITCRREPAEQVPSPNAEVQDQPTSPPPRRSSRLRRPVSRLGPYVY